jgi:ABC-type antimicrobial peptide transport system permease subunit
VYLPVKQMQTSGLTLLVRAGAKPTTLIPSLLGIVGNIDRRMPVYSVHTLDVQMDAGLSSERILGYLSVMFAALATLLAGIGLYGVMAYLVAQRTREIGIRLSTGAQRLDIAHLFARESAILICVGVAVGVPLAIISSSGLRAVLFGVTTSDPVTLTISVAALLAAAAIATAYPVIKAAQTSPMAALRYE